MAKKPIMSLATINTILNTAPIVIQGATRLIKMIRDQGEQEQPEIPETIDGIKREVERINERLDANSKADVEQIKLIEALAKQNESLAAQLKTTMSHLNRITLLAIAALIVGGIALVFTLTA